MIYRSHSLLKNPFFSGISLPGTFGVRFPQQIWDDFLAMYRMSFFLAHIG